MRCEEFEAIIFSGAEPDAAQQEAMQAHAKGCEACRVLMEQADVLSGSRELDAQAEPPQRFSDAWRRAVRITPQQTGLKARFAQWLSALRTALCSRAAMRTAAYALCAVALVGAGTQLGRVASGVNSAANGVAYSRSAVYYDSAEEEMVTMAAYDAAPMMKSTASGSVGGAGNALTADTERKILRSAQLEMETEAFDAAVEAIRARALEMGGGVTYCEVRISGEQHYADLQLSIPDEQLDTFLEGAEQLGEVTRRVDSQDDMTAAYQDNASRLESARAQKQQLDALYAQAEDMSDIVAITDALFDVQQEIDALEGSNRWIDERADNAQVSISVEEKLSGDGGEGFFARLFGSFSDGCSSIGAFAGGVILFAAWALPWLILIGAGVLAVRRLNGRKR